MRTVQTVWNCRAILEHSTACVTMLGCLAFGATRLRAEEVIPPELTNLSRVWVDYHWSEIAERRKLLIAAYEISEEQAPAFLHVYYEAWQAYFQHHIAFGQRDKSNETPEESAQRIYEFADTSPTSDLGLMKVAESILEARDFKESRHRFVELNTRGTEMRNLDVTNQVSHDSLLRTLQDVRMQAAAPLSIEGKPRPFGVGGLQPKRRLLAGEIIKSPETCVQASLLRELNPEIYARAMHREKPTVIAINVPGTRALDGRPARAFDWSVADSSAAKSEAWVLSLGEDDWVREARRLMTEFESRHTSDGEESRQARDMLDETVRRAELVRRGNAEAYAALKELNSRREFSERLAKLDTALDGLTQELKARLTYSDGR